MLQCHMLFQSILLVSVVLMSSLPDLDKFLLWDYGAPSSSFCMDAIMKTYSGFIIIIMLFPAKNFGKNIFIPYLGA